MSGFIISDDYHVMAMMMMLMIQAKLAKLAKLAMMTTAVQPEVEMMITMMQVEVDVALCRMLQGLVEECGNLWSRLATKSPSSSS